ncbi:extracellular substrate-binding protein [Bordetella ansorpii]|uniref:Extracellular substrate-binding protein n=1 Tax=Bordetella ansorpii TaxID=288768 RepID=A0A157Q7G9_9BORD|nr:ABC transporter substrate-binding protein [Bordetella ansorpii]SAI41707.1 extracellular substrate-binding protein [Bordetella ansorpii]
MAIKKEQHAAATHQMSRRAILKAGAALPLAGLAGWSSRAGAAQSITVTCWGGDYEKSVRAVFAEPFTKETGIAVNLINNADLTKLKVQVRNKNVSWDVFDSIGPHILSGSKDEMWEPLDKSIVDTSDLIVPGGADHIGTFLFGAGIAFDPKRTPEGKHPTNFKEFWDVERFPGRRALRPRVSEMLEIALVADGVAPADLYPLDVERAFKALERIKPHVRKWTETTPETISLVLNNEVDFSYSFVTRVIPSQQAGNSIDIPLTQTVNAVEYLAVPKYTKNREAAMRYLAFVLRPDRQAEFSNRMFFSPNAKAAQAQVADATKRYLPDMKNPNNIIINDAWWADNFEKLQKRFTGWLLV